MSRRAAPSFLLLLGLASCSDYGFQKPGGDDPGESDEHAPRSDDDADGQPRGEPDTGPGDTGPDDTGPDDEAVPQSGDSDHGEPDAGDPGAEPDPEDGTNAQVCEDVEGGNCNDDLGYGDQCDAEDNTGGCSDEKFWAWCNRRNDAYPGIWDRFLHDWVDDRCDGTITLEDPDGDGYDTYTCRNADGTLYTCTTPLVLAFAAEVPVRFTAVGHTFPLDPARPLRHDWPTVATPWLALDRNGDGRITDGTELFGSATPVPGGGPAANGFAALATLDANADGRVDGLDPAFGRLLLWADADGDGRSAPSELRRAADVGLVRLGLDYRFEPRCDGQGNCERERAALEWRDEAGTMHVGAVVDVYVSGHAPLPALASSAP